MTLWMPQGFQPSRAALDAAAGGGTTVTVDQVCSAAAHSGTTATSFDYNNMSVTGGLTNSALVAAVCVTNNISISAVTAVWDAGTTAQSMTALGSVTGGGAAGVQVFLFGRRSPTAGNNLILRVSWTTGSQVSVSAVSFSNVDQSSDGAAFTGFTANSTAATPITVTVSSSANDKVVAGFADGANVTSTSDTEFGRDNAGNAYAVTAAYGTGSASKTITCNPGHATLSAAAGVNVHAG